mmetsp:Transcript_13477/g.19866  ORF Transcript_13477/g.19866 Transcript_13477/m.19866 type:complete len:210 (-) Transcript_13477:1326-1955(-)
MSNFNFFFRATFLFVLMTAQAFRSSTLITQEGSRKCTANSLSMSHESVTTGQVSTLFERRSFISLGVFSGLALQTNPAVAAGKDTIDSMIGELTDVKSKLEPIPRLLQAEDWEGVRTILKSPPVNFLWNVGVDKNTLVRLSQLTDDIELLELKDDLAISLQMCDQFTYGNVFVYFQPGNGKVKVKEPTELANKAMRQIDDAIKMARESQ